jgi:toxin YoeB
MEIKFTALAWEDYAHWAEIDRKQLLRINKLTDAILSDPFAGIGKPESLRHQRQGYWSRRIDNEHRLVYKVAGEELIIVQCRFHY